MAIDTPGGNLSLKIKSRAQQITLKPNIIKVKFLISYSNVSLFTIQHLQSNLNEFTCRVWYIYFYDFKILSSGTSEWDLLIRESLLISQLNPVLNANIRSTPLELF